MVAELIVSKFFFQDMYLTVLFSETSYLVFDWLCKGDLWVGESL